MRGHCQTQMRQNWIVYLCETLESTIISKNEEQNRSLIINFGNWIKQLTGNISYLKKVLSCCLWISDTTCSMLY